MKILQISPQISYPADSGGRLSIYGITKYLAERGHTITFISYVKKEPKPEQVIELNKICNPIFIPFSTINNFFDAILNLFSVVPYNIAKYKSKKLKKVLIEYFEKNEVDIVHVDHLHMAWTIDIINRIKKVPIVLREHNLEMKIMERFSSQQSNLFLKLYSYLQFQKFKYYEPKQCAKFDKCLMISNEDEKSLLHYDQKINTCIIPIGVDDELFEIVSVKNNIYSLFHIGSLKWQPNLDGLIWFLKYVFPAVVSRHPLIKLFVYSSGIEKIKLANEIKKNVILCGYVNDIWEETSDKNVLIVPLKVGSGMRVKIIEMMAAGKIIVSTSVGKEGIEVNDNEHLLIADDSDTFVQKILNILENKVDTGKLISNARLKVADKYSWRKIAEEIENIYNSVILENNSSS